MTGETRIIVNPNPTEWIYTGGTSITLIGSGNTQATNTVGSTWVVYTPTGGTAAWGNISGTLSDQADLQSALDLKLDSTALAGYWNSGQTVSYINDQGFITSLAGYWTSGQTIDYVTGYTPTLDGYWNSGETVSYINSQNYLTGVTWSIITDKPDLALQANLNTHTGNTAIHFEMSEITGFTSSLAFSTYTGTTAPSQFLSSSALDNYWDSGETQSYISSLNYVTASIIDNIWTSAQTITWVNDQGFLTGVTWNDIDSKPAYLGYVSGLTSAAQTQIDAKASKTVTVNEITTTGFTLTNDYSNEIIELSNTGATTVTLPTGLTGNIQFTFVNTGGQTITFEAGTGAALRSKDDNVKLESKYGAVSVYSTSSGNYWRLIGDLT